jgi:hypothetical protein
MPHHPFTPQHKRDLKRILRDLQAYFDNAFIYPRGNLLLDRVVLIHVSKALRVAQSVMALIDAGYGEEAFGLSRTMVEVGLNLRFITNRHSVRRAQRFVDYKSVWQLELKRRSLKHFYQRDEQGQLILDEKGEKIPTYTKAELRKRMSDYPLHVKAARKFPKYASSWTDTRHRKGKRSKTTGVRMMAKEPDRYEFVSGVPFNWEFDYDWMYFWTSQYVHGTVVCMESHAVYPRQPFSIHNAPARLKHTEGLAAFNTAAQLNKILLAAFRAIGHEYPAKLSTRMSNLLFSMIGKEPPKPERTKRKRK